MIVTKDILLQFFLKWRDLYFTNYLDVPIFVITKTFKRVARFECTLNYDGSISDETIYFSNQFDYTERELNELMAHEMIHYYLCKSGMDRKCSHGKHFLTMANDINEKYLMNVEKYVYGLTKRKDYSKIRSILSFLE